MKRLFQLMVLLNVFLLIFFTPYTANAASVHRVAPGENLYIIAESYGITVEEIIKKNNLQNPDFILLGQELLISDSGESNIYIVQPGDSLYKISNKLGISMEKLAVENNLNNEWNFLNEGQALKIPQVLLPPQPDTPFQNTVSQLARMFPDTFYLRGLSNTNRVALTFDDGPDKKYTPQVLDVLRDYQVRATFFLIGNRAEKCPEVVEKIAAEGHVIGNHSWSHPDLRWVSNERLISEIVQTEMMLEQITGLKTALIRPPYGTVDTTSLEEMKRLEYKVINWSVDSVDWRDQNPHQIIQNTLPYITRESIVLFHSAGGEGQSMAATVDVLPEIIESIRGLGYTFVTVDELLGIPAYK